MRPRALAGSSPTLSRRRLLLAAAAGGAALAGAGGFPRAAAAATDDELAYANFGAASELLLQDFYAHASAAAKLYKGAARNAFARGGFAAEGARGRACPPLLDGLRARQRRSPRTSSLPGPRRTFADAEVGGDGWLTIVDALLGAYLTAAATSPTQVGAASCSPASPPASASSARRSCSRADASAIGNSFPAAVDLEAASAAVERFLG